MEELTIKLDTWEKAFPKLERISLGFGEDYNDEDSMTDIQKKSKDFLIKNQEKLLDIILNDLFTRFEEIREDYSVGDEGTEYYIPHITTIDELKEMLEPDGIDLHDVEKDDYGYLGFAFHCTWDEEHAYGIMMHKYRIVDTGGADTSFRKWIAKKDAGNE